MMVSIFKNAREFFRREDGNPTVEFAIVFPALITILLSSVEMGFVTFRHTMLERGLDEAMREVRLGTGQTFNHDTIKDSICQYSGVLPECDSRLRLEMIRNDMRNWVDLTAQADCIDRSQPVQPVRAFQSGLDNELMVVRACYKFEPIFPTSGLGSHFQTDEAGDVSMVASSAFVQEPR